MNEPSLVFRFRQWLLLLSTMATLMVPIELLFVEHYEEWKMYIPFVLSGLTLIGIFLVAFWPNKKTLLLFRIVMAFLLVGSLLGVYFHLSGNLELTEEINPELVGFSRIWDILSGAAPALAPGLLAQVALMGFLFTYKHPKNI
jgi:hypothetical protein